MCEMKPVYCAKLIGFYIAGLCFKGNPETIRSRGSSKITEPKTKDGFSIIFYPNCKSSFLGRKDFLEDVLLASDSIDSFEVNLFFTCYFSVK